MLAQPPAYLTTGNVRNADMKGPNTSKQPASACCGPAQNLGTRSGLGKDGLQGPCISPFLSFVLVYSKSAF